MVGPFIFIDHMGPEHLEANQNMDVPPHPHIGLSTLTFLFEGNIMHRDTLGSEIEITPGAVNWMTAGKGIVHSERSPENLRGVSKTIHGLQIWVALPKHLEDMDPEFFHLEKSQIPRWNENGLDFTLVAGEAFGKRSPVPVYSKLYMIGITSNSQQTLSIGDQLYGESGLYILEGSVEVEGNTYGAKQLLIADNTSLCEFTMNEGTTIYIFGGEPFPEERFIDWNFVSSEKPKLETAKQKWINREFDKIKGEENDFVPYPEKKL